MTKIRICQNLLDKLYDQATIEDKTVTGVLFEVVTEYFKKKEIAND